MILHAIKKPIQIQVEEFQPHITPWPKGVQVDQLEKDPVEYFVYNELRGTRAFLLPGDYVNVTNEHDLYPIARSVFDATYDVLR
jgi:hypothetical protein